MAALVLIIVASFYHVQVADIFSLSSAAEGRVYSLGMFWAAAIGGYGVVVTVFGIVQSPRKNDAPVRILPLIVGVVGIILLFFSLLSSSFDGPGSEEPGRLRSGESITI